MLVNRKTIFTLAVLFGSLAVLGLTVVRVRNLQTVLQRPKASGAVCDTDQVDLMVSPTTVSVGNQITFTVVSKTPANAAGSTWIQDYWTGPNLSSRVTTNANGCGCNSTDQKNTYGPGDPSQPAGWCGFYPTRTCTTANFPGTHQWVHIWRHCDSTTDCSATCFKTKDFTIDSSGGGCVAINSSANPSMVAPGGAVSFSFTSSKGYTWVNLNGGGNCGNVSVSGGPPYTWTWNCTAPSSSGSYTANFSNAESCPSSVGYSVSGGGACSNPYSPTYGQPQGQISGVSPNFSWTWCDPSKINWSTVYLWNCNPASCSSAFAAANGGGYTNGNIALSGFALIGGGGAVTLQPNTQYWWSLNPNSCASYPSTNCPVGSGPGIASFTTGSAPTHLACVSSSCQSVAGGGGNTEGCTSAGQACCTSADQCSADKICSNNNCVIVPCSTAEVCKTATVANHVCTIANKTDGTACETGGKTCQSGICTAPSCPTGQTPCNGVCKNLQTDPANCGTCGNACASNQSCTSGTCANTSCAIDPDCSGGNVCAFP